jgi:hypothetical protein
MGLDHLFLDFMQRIAVGAGAVLVLLVCIGLQMPRRSVIIASRRITN